VVRPALAVGAVAGVMSAAVAAGLGGCDLAGGSTAGPRAAAEGAAVADPVPETVGGRTGGPDARRVGTPRVAGAGVRPPGRPVWAA